MKNEKICFNKSVGIIGAVALILGLFTYSAVLLTQNATSTSTRASVGKRQTSALPIQQPRNAEILVWKLTGYSGDGKMKFESAKVSRGVTLKKNVNLMSEIEYKGDRVQLEKNNKYLVCVSPSQNSVGKENGVNDDGFIYTYDRKITLTNISQGPTVVPVKKPGTAYVGNYMGQNNSGVPDTDFILGKKTSIDVLSKTISGYSAMKYGIGCSEISLSYDNINQPVLMGGIYSKYTNGKKTSFLIPGTNESTSFLGEPIKVVNLEVELK